MFKSLTVLIVSILCFSSCVSIPNKHTALAPGEWRAVLKLYDANQEINAAQEQSETVKEFTELPFVFDVIYDTPDSFHIEMRNGKERIIVDDIIYGLDRATAMDTVIIEFPTYDTYLKGIVEENIIEGHWYVNYKENYKIPFIAYHGQAHRFSTVKSDAEDYSGLWDISFDYDTEDPYSGIADLKQEGNYLEGTIMTETGDYRFLEGEVQGPKMKLSVFDGAHAFYFEAKITDDNTTTGVFKSGKHYTSNFSATRNPAAKLGDPFGLTKIVDDGYNWNTEFINTSGQNESLAKENWNQTPIKIINIIGTWCPNCKDENNFLVKYMEENPTVNIDITSVCFERYKDDIERNIQQIKTYKNKMDIPWRLMYGGYASKQLASEKFPFLNKIISYPTMMILDKDNTIKYVHTGFNGPATSEYPGFVAKFDAIIKELSK